MKQEDQITHRIRAYREKDYPFLFEMLEERGFVESEMAFSESPTWIIEKDNTPVAFITIEDTEDYPYLRHFCVSKECSKKESIKLMWKLSKLASGLIKDRGFNFMYFYIPEKDILFNKIAIFRYNCILLGTDFYGASSKHNQYLVEVR